MTDQLAELSVALHQHERANLPSLPERIGIFQHDHGKRVGATIALDYAISLLWSRTRSDLGMMLVHRHLFEAQHVREDFAAKVVEMRMLDVVMLDRVVGAKPRDIQATT